MAQNKYDDGAFFNEFMHLPSQSLGLQGAPEWPSFRSLLPEVRGSKVLDLGCGQGFTCRWVREMGAKLAYGVDISEKMLASAESFPSDPSVEYEHSDLESIQLPSTSYNLVVSSLALHYIERLPSVFAQVFKTLTPGGTFVFSVEHPMYTSPTNPEWNRDPEAPPVDDYLLEGPRSTNWLTEGVIKQHRTFATYINFLIRAGFAIGYVIEWGPNKEQVEKSWQLADHRNRPRFLIVKATKSVNSDAHGQVQHMNGDLVCDQKGME
jgi:ubiquinone/menaquinone biosynthesis C-methylase UbiE